MFRKSKKGKDSSEGDASNDASTAGAETDDIGWPTGSKPLRRSRKGSMFSGNYGVEMGVFDAYYLGSVNVNSPQGNDVCDDAMLRIKALQSDPKEVKLTITSRGIFVIDAKTSDIVKQAPVQAVSFVSMNSKDKKRFSYITADKDLNLLFCHGFTVKSKVKEIAFAINQAFLVSSGKMPEPEGKRLDLKKLRKVALETAEQIREEQRLAHEQQRGNVLGTFPAKYLGSVAVGEPRGNEVTKDAIRRIKELKQLKRNVDIIVSQTHIDVVDASTQDEIKSVPIMHISFSAVDSSDSKLVCYITNDARLGLIYCHAFQTKSKGQELLNAIGTAFKDAKDKLEQHRGDADRLKELGLLPITSVRGPGGALGVFEAKYIGSVPSFALTGTYAVDSAIISARSLETPPEGVVLVISSEGIRTVEGLTGETLNNVFISNISYTTTAGSKKDIFAYISNDARLKRTLCHVYECRKAQDVTKCIGEAFAVAAQERKDRAGNPFAADSSDRESVQGVLFRYQLHRRDLAADRAIGAGQFGQVYLATYKSERRVAVKTVRQGATDEDKAEFVREAETMVELEHPSLVALIGVAIQQRPWLCVIEFMKYGDLRDVLQTCREKNIDLSYAEQLNYGRQLADGLAFIAEKRFIHMDIAARNCLLAENNIVKVADFGLTRKLEAGTDEFVLKKSAKLPVRWMAVESLSKKVFSQKTDVWSFGVLLWEILSYGRLPYYQIKNKDVQSAIKGGTRLEMPPGECMAQYYHLAAKCWETSPDDRYTFKELASLLETMFEEQKKKDPELRDIGAVIQSA